MKLFLIVDTSNAAFDCAGLGSELDSIMHTVVTEVVTGTTGKRIMDSNGNTVGEWGYVSEYTSLMEGIGDKTEKTLTLTLAKGEVQS